MVLFASGGIRRSACAVAESAGKPVVMPLAGEPPISVVVLVFGDPVLWAKMINSIVCALCYFRFAIPAFAEGGHHKDFLELLVLPYILQVLDRIAELLPRPFQIAL